MPQTRHRPAPRAPGPASPPPAVILAGGAGRRIGGDKAAVQLAGRSLLAHVRARLAPQAGALALNAAVAPAEAADLPCLADPVPGAGPLGGLLAALDWGAGLGVARVATVPVDTPFLPGDLLARLAAVPGAAYAETADGAHPVIGLWPVALRDDLRAALRAGRRRVTDWTGAVGARPVPFEDAAAFANVNTPDDLARAAARLR